MQDTRQLIPASIALLIATEATRHTDDGSPMDERIASAHAFSSAARAGWLNRSYSPGDDEPVHAVSAGYDYGTRLRREDPLRGENILAEYAGGA